MAKTAKKYTASITVEFNEPVTLDMARMAIMPRMPKSSSRAKVSNVSVRKKSSHKKKKGLW